ncbi:class I SAM-dependent methyltransferase [Paenibacillus polymyxa]|uniref:class I SAM-dependent methyltransferase n=1 Tax=Paenibacillus polymyxa TaxID=1406 RepID=UPI002AB4E9CA|nr:class I SAM-dependent methyltransferase [Paenibacillus polymyxa]MDY8023280.1 class I SAM-dependent methyltransferase [Paenibacillus polymyxa]
MTGAFVVFFTLLSPVYYLNKWDFKRNTRRNPFYTSKLVQLQSRYPIFYELAMYVQNFPVPHLVYKALPKLAGDVLQVGCGTGLLNKYMCKNKDIRWINMDPNLNSLRLGSRLGRFSTYVHASIDKRTSLYQNSCDTILFARSFHHIRNHKKAFVECVRLLREEGRIIIADPVVLEEKEKHSTQKGYMANSSIDGVIWRFSQESFVRHLQMCLPPELEIESITDIRQPHVTNYNLFVPQTDIIAVLKKRRNSYAAENH